MRTSPILQSGFACAVALLGTACDQLLPDRSPVVAAPPAVESTPSAVESPPARRRAPARKASAVGEEEAFGMIRRGLRRLVAAEQGFYAENGVYTEDLDRLGFRPEGDSRFRFLWLTRAGWAASGTHPAIPGRDCVIFVGRVNAAPTTIKYVRSAREGVPACDVTPPPPRQASTASPQPTPVADTASALAAVSPFVQMRVDLRNLAHSQEAYRAAQGTYSRRIEPLAVQYLWQRGYSVAILHADPSSWSARASHAALPGKSCVMWVGPVRTRPVTDDQRKVAEGSGVPVCDE